MAWTKQHFERIAEIIDSERQNAESYATHEDRVQTLEWLTVELAGEFEAGNPRFDRQRFYAAAGFPEADD